MTFQPKSDYYSDVAAGLVPGRAILRGLGEFESGNVNVLGEDVTRAEDISGPVRLPTPAPAGEQMTIVSTDAQDGVGGTGVLTVRVHYLDATGAEQVEDKTMNGLTGVDTAAVDMRFIQDFYALTVGTDGVAAGNITLIKKGGAIATDLYNLIGIGGNKSLIPHRMVPIAKKLILKGWGATEAQGSRCAFRLRSTDMYGVLIPGVFCFKDVLYLNQDTQYRDGLNILVPALSIVKVSYWADQVAAEGSTTWWGELIDD